MHAARNGSRSRSLIRQPLLLLAFSILLGAVSFAAMVLFWPMQRTETGYSSLLVAGATDTSVLHIRAIRSELGAGSAGVRHIEVWLDEQTNEGKVVETSPVGVIQRVETFERGVYTLYLADGRHAVVRRGVSPDSPYATRLRNQLLLYRMATERGTARVVGKGQVGSITTDRVEFQAGDVSVTADIDPVSGLPLREQFAGGQSRETAYNLIERLRRSDISLGAFSFVIPAEATREEYAESAALSSVSVPYTIYAAPSLGAPKSVFQRASGGSGVPTSNTYYLIYQTNEGGLQILSGLPPEAAFMQTKGVAPVGHPSQRVQVGSTVWQVEETSQGFQGITILSGTLVTIHAPNQGLFERVADDLQRYEAR